MREAGLIIISDPGADKPLCEVATLQCVHCGKHWVPRPGSGITRGTCLNCMGPICGPDCATCVPTEVMLENMEQRRPLDFRPIVVPVSF
jgi:hypothetical protein